MNTKLLSLAAAAACFLSALQGCATQPADREGISAHFTGVLDGTCQQYTESQRIPLDSVEARRALVWDLWAEANRAFPEQKLSEPAPLDSSHSAFVLDSLEPVPVMPYRWGSKGERPKEGWPMFIYLHGSGPRDYEWQTGLLLAQMFDDAPSVYFIPQIPSEGGYYRWWQKMKQQAWEKVFRQALALGYADPDRMYFTGISEGGYGSQRLASFYADYLAAAGPMAGGEPLKNAPAENCANIAFSLRTGERDYGFYRDRLTGYVKEEFEKLHAAYPDLYGHWIELVPGMGHAIDYRPTPKWLREFKRNPYPKFVAWEDFEMDGRHRDGFYNIEVLRRPEDGRRMMYRMSIEDNSVDITVEDVAYETVETDPVWGIELKFVKSYTPSVEGCFRVYLCPELVDMDRPVTVTVNGKEVFNGTVECDMKHLVNSCARYFDPRRLYPAAVDVDLSQLM